MARGFGMKISVGGIVTSILVTVIALAVINRVPALKTITGQS